MHHGTVVCVRELLRTGLPTNVARTAAQDLLQPLSTFQHFKSSNIHPTPETLGHEVTQCKQQKPHDGRPSWLMWFRAYKFATAMDSPEELAKQCQQSNQEATDSPRRLPALAATKGSFPPALGQTQCTMQGFDCRIFCLTDSVH